MCKFLCLSQWWPSFVYYSEGNEDEGGYTIVDEDHIVVKAEYNDVFDDVSINKEMISQCGLT